MDTVSLELLKQWNTEKYKIAGSREAQVVLFGEHHHSERHWLKQRELILALKPEFVLHEFANIWAYSPAKKEWCIAPGRRANNQDIEEFCMQLHGDQERFEAIAQETPCIIAGCNPGLGETDLFKKGIAMSDPKRYRFEPSPELGEFVGELIDRKNPKMKFLPSDPLIMQYRDAFIANVILQYLKKTARLVIVVVGRDHLPGIARILKGKRVAFLSVDQSTGRA